MDEPEHWTCTVVRAHGLQFMRRERSWRPIVTIELDKTQQHETTLGSDGQNINLKESFHLRDASLTSLVEVKVFYRSQSKKKGKKRNLVGSVSCSLGEMWKKHGKEPKLELRLQCQNPTNRSIGNRGRPQNGALIYLRLLPPASITTYPDPTPSEDDGYSSTSSSPSSSHGSATLAPPSITEERPHPVRRRRRIRGYCVNSDDEPESYSETDDDETKPFLGGPSFDDEDERGPLSPIKISFNPVQWIATSFLPQYTERIEVPADPDLYFFERVISSFTAYKEMKQARCDDDFERLFTRFQLEWTYTIGILVGLAAVDTAVFSISPDSLFVVHPLARGAVAASSVASGLGIVCAAWLLVRYAWVDLHTFVTRAADVMSTDTPSFFFFSLSARIPALLMLASAIALMLFLAFVAFSAWPMAVIMGCFLVGLLMGLQFFVFSILWVVKSVRKVFRFLVGLVWRDKEGLEVADEKH